MVARLYERAQDPNDSRVDASFTWRTWTEIPAANIYNMDEVGSDTNKGRKKKIAGTDSMHDGFRHVYEITDGDNNPFHVTNCLTTCAHGTTPIPPYLGHSSPSTKSKTDAPKITAQYLSGLYAIDEDGKQTREGGRRTGFNSR